MDPDDDFRKLAVAGSSVLGDSAELKAHRCKQGDYFFYGMGLAAILAFGFAQIGVSPLWLIAVGLLIGWLFNERERKRVKSEVAARRA